MAIDTKRRRIEELVRRERARRVPAGIANPPRDPRRRGPGRSGGRGLVAFVAMLGMFWFREPLGIAPWIDGAIERVQAAGLPGCAALATHYDRAARGLGGSSAASAEAAFERARKGCDRELVTYASSSRAQACETASRHFARALERRRALGATLPSGTAGGTIGVSAAGIVAGDDGAREEAVARSVFGECAG